MGQKSQRMVEASLYALVRRDTDLARPASTEDAGVAPRNAQRHPEIAPARRQRVGRPRRMLGVELPGDDAVLLENLQTLRQHIGGDPGERGLKVLEAPRAGEQVADEQQRPALAEQLERLGHRTALAVTLGHGASIVLDRNASH